MFCTPENKITVKLKTKGVPIFIFNKAFYGIRDHNYEVSSNGLLFYGSSAPPVLELPEFDLKSFTILYERLEREFKVKDALQGEMLLTILKQMLIISPW